ncbi:MAG: hypothetical protein HY864_15850 [Chloroflexi bacterium]|nr:hypothetical protein [Chloroflexota bacterium]
MTRFAIYVSIIAAAAVLAVGLGIQGHILPAVGVSLLGAAWAFAFRRNMLWVATPAFALFTIISASSIWAGVSPWLSMIGLISSLIVWDLTNFLQRLQAANESPLQIERTHFQQLGLVSGLSLLGVYTATRIRISLTFGGAAILAMLGIWGISALVYRLRRHEDEIDV